MAGWLAGLKCVFKLTLQTGTEGNKKETYASDNKQSVLILQNLYCFDNICSTNMIIGNSCNLTITVTVMTDSNQLL